MKNLILIRHAKSSWSAPGLRDYERPLNERGKKDAPVMATRLLNRKYPIDLFISSPAERAAKTALYFSDAYHYKPEDIQFIPSLYLASPEVFFDVLKNVDDRYNHVALVSHNNGLTDFANMLSNARIDNMPTCSVFAVKIKTENWSDIK